MLKRRVPGRQSRASRLRALQKIQLDFRARLGGVNCSGLGGRRSVKIGQFDKHPAGSTEQRGTHACFGWPYVELHYWLPWTGTRWVEKVNSSRLYVGSRGRARECVCAAPWSAIAYCAVPMILILIIRTFNLWLSGRMKYTILCGGKNNRDFFHVFDVIYGSYHMFIVSDWGWKSASKEEFPFDQKYMRYERRVCVLCVLSCVACTLDNGFAAETAVE